jgi:hypothetical protein
MSLPGLGAARLSLSLPALRAVTPPRGGAARHSKLDRACAGQARRARPRDALVGLEVDPPYLTLRQNRPMQFEGFA